MKYIILPLLIALTSSVFGQTTKIEKSWRDPSTIVKMGQFNKILVVAFVKDKSNQKMIEDDIIKILKSKAVASYQILGDGKTVLTEAELGTKILEDGFDGAVVMRLMDTEKDLGYVPGTGTYPAYYKEFDAYYDGAHAAFSDEGYYADNKVYLVETNMYSLKEGKLIWSGITSTMNPGNIDKMLSKIGKVLTDEMKRQGFLY